MKIVLCGCMGEIKVTVHIVESYLSESDLYGGRSYEKWIALSPGGFSTSTERH